MSPRWGSTPRRTDRLTIGRNVTLTDVTKSTPAAKSFYPLQLDMRVMMKLSEKNSGNSYQYYFLKCSPLTLQNTKFQDI
jgi:hypothetical protein